MPLEELNQRRGERLRPKRLMRPKSVRPEGNAQRRYWAMTVTETGMEFGGLQAFASQAW